MARRVSVLICFSVITFPVWTLPENMNSSGDGVSTSLREPRYINSCTEWEHVRAADALFESVQDLLSICISHPHGANAFTSNPYK